MSLYKHNKTDPNLEKNGIELDYGDYRITIARAGGANKRFAKVLEAKAKPYRRAIQTETMDPERSADILREAYAEAVILNWETKVDGKFKQGIESPDGKLLPFNTKNVDMTLKNLEVVFADIQDAASKHTLFLEVINEDNSKN